MSDEINGATVSKIHNKKINPLILLLVILFVCFTAASTAVIVYFDSRRAETERLLNEERALLAIHGGANTLRRQIHEREQAEQRAAEDYEALRAELTAEALMREREGLLMLVNRWNKIPEDLEIELVDIYHSGEVFQIDVRAAESLKMMLSDCEEAGFTPVLISAYRTWEYQQNLYVKKIQKLLQAGTAFDQAPDIAAQSVAAPGTSEHQLGLAVDIIDYWFTGLTYYQQFTGTQRWLMEHCAEYGFILRYPEGTSDITGVIFEPWHYRFVGRELAAMLSAEGITFEEYNNTLGVRISNEPY